MNKFFSAIARAPKRLLDVMKRAPKRSAAVAMIAGAVIVPAALLAFGPDRPTFTWANPAPYVTFDSITDNPSVGDERNFVRIKDASATSDYTDNVALQPGKTYSVELYYHNDAASNLNEKATDATARISMPATVAAGDSATITGYLDASNANPTSVWDSATGSSSSAVALRYVQGSATFTSNGAINGQTVPDSLFTTGANLGYDAQDGTLPGCNQYAGYITFEFTVDQPNFSVVKQVSVDGGQTWGTNETTTPGSTVKYRIEYTNTGTTEMDNVIDQDTLPAGVSYVPGTSYYASANTGGQYKAIPDGVTTVGFNTGGFLPTANSFLEFQAKVADNDTLPVCGPNTLVNTATAGNADNGTKSATASLDVTKTCVTPPVYSCNALTSSLISGTEYSFTPSASASNGASIVNYIYSFGDGTSTTSTTASPVTHTYPSTTANYTATLSVTVNVNGVDQVITAPACKTQICVTVTPPAPVYTCDALISSFVSGSEYSFTPNATATNGATIVSYGYSFGDGTSTTSTTNSAVTHTYPTTGGTYKAILSVTFLVNGTNKVVTSDNCEATITISKAPVYTCDALTATLVSGTEYSFTPTASAGNGATIVNYLYDFGDGTNATSTDTTAVTHTYPTTSASYTAKLTVTVDVNGVNSVISGVNCSAAITITQTPPPVTPPVTPPALPHTGADLDLGTLLGLGALVASVGYYINSRRALLGR
jgi:uncharacterized repeat protein (TIGR01451 family)